MRDMLLLAGVCGLLLALTATAQEQPAPQPKLALSQEAWNFGSVWHGERPEFTLTIRNEGNADLKLIKVGSSWGCIAAQPGRLLLPPGEATEVKIEFTTQGKQKDVGSYVRIKSNDPVRPEFKFQINGYVKRAVFRSRLGGIGITSLDPSPGQTGTITLENQMPQPMKLELKSNNFPGVEVRIVELSPGQKYDIVARTTEPMPPGATRGSIVLSTGLEREPELSVNIQVKIYNLVHPSPAAVLVGKNDALKQRMISLHYYGSKQDFRITKAEADHDVLRATVSNPVDPPEGMRRLTPAPTATVRSRITIPPISEIPGQGIHVTYTTNDPACPTADVLVTANKAEWRRIMYGRSAAARSERPRQ